MPGPALRVARASRKPGLPQAGRSVPPIEARHRRPPLIRVSSFFFATKIGLGMDPRFVARCAAASVTLLALTACIGLFWKGQVNGVSSLEQAASDSVTAREQSLHYGSNYFESAFGVSGDLNHHWWCGHYFRSLCRTEGKDQTTIWYQKTDWLDYSSRLKVLPFQLHKED